MFDRAASRLGWCGLIALWVLVAPGFWAGSARAGSLAAGNPTVSFVPVGTCVKPGAVCTLQVVVDAAVDSLSCMELYIRYDTASAECTTALEGACYKGSGYPTFFRWEKVSPDTVSAVDCVLGYRSFFRAPGEI
ncbi:MAG TPA: hypothetical protein VMT60_02005, partial [Candidatus Bathyarchaeia archaeon]|nr:hypothetical protein [Candidatus Bathyarchaeia archaeon]